MSKLTITGVIALNLLAATCVAGGCRRYSYSGPGVYSYASARGSSTSAGSFGTAPGPGGGGGGGVPSVEGAGLQPLAMGQVINGELTTSDRQMRGGVFYDVYAFQGRAGDRVQFWMASGNYRTLLAVIFGGRLLQHEDGVFDASNNVYAAGVSGTLPYSGTYYIVCMSHPAATSHVGRYSVVAGPQQ